MLTAVSRVDVGLRATFYREYLLLTRSRTNLLLAVVPTAVYLLLFATSLTRLVGTVQYHGATFGYAEFTIPAIMLSSMLSAAATTGTSLFQEELSGMALELWSYPLRRSSYVAGKLIATTTLVLAQSLGALVVGVAVFRIAWSAGQWLALVAGTVVASLMFNAFYLLLSSFLHDFQRFIVTINVLGPLLLFSSPSFYPVDRMPVPLQWLSTVNPVTYGIRCLRDGALFGFGAMAPWAALLLGIAGFLLVVTGRTLLLRAQEL